MNERIINGSVTLVVDRMFGAVMRHANLCAEMIDRILKPTIGESIGEITYISKQESLAKYLTDQDARLDIYCTDSCEGRNAAYYDLEMQEQYTSFILYRARRYHSKMDAKNIKKGTKDNEIGNSYVIFLCAFDLFGYGDPVYIEKKTILRHPEKLIEDGQTTIYVNLTCGIEKFMQIDEKLANVVQYIQTKQVTDDFTKELDDMVEYVNKVDREEECHMLTAEQKRAEELQGSRDEGWLEGRVYSLSKDLGLTIQQIAEKLNISEDSVSSILSRVGI